MWPLCHMLCIQTLNILHNLAVWHQLAEHSWEMAINLALEGLYFFMPVALWIESYIKFNWGETLCFPLMKVTISLWNQRATRKPRQQAGDITLQQRLSQVLKTCFFFFHSGIWFSFVLHILTENMDPFGCPHAQLLESLNTQFCCKTNQQCVVLAGLIWAESLAWLTVSP